MSSGSSAASGGVRPSTIANTSGLLKAKASAISRRTQSPGRWMRSSKVYSDTTSTTTSQR